MKLKGTIEANTSNVIIVKCKIPLNGITKDSILSDFSTAASSLNFIGSDGNPIVFNYMKEEDVENEKIKYKQFYFCMSNLGTISFQDSFKDAPLERQQLFNSWTKFWISLSKFGYKIN